MANTRSAKKRIRSSATKNEHNLMWKRRIKAMQKAVLKTLKTTPENTDILKTQQANLQKVVDKAAKEKVIHKNKANRIKARSAQKIVTAHAVQKETKSESTTAKPAKSGVKRTTKKSKSNKS